MAGGPYSAGMAPLFITLTRSVSDSGNRGDVPGWVLITLMTAGLVIGVWTAAGPALAGVFDQAISRVTSF